MYEVRRTYETAFSFLFSPQKGYGVVLCRAGDAERVTELIRGLAASAPESPTPPFAAQSGEPGGD